MAESPADAIAYCPHWLRLFQERVGGGVRAKVPRGSPICIFVRLPHLGRQRVKCLREPVGREPCEPLLEGKPLDERLKQLFQACFRPLIILRRFGPANLAKLFNLILKKSVHPPSRLRQQNTAGSVMDIPFQRSQDSLSRMWAQDLP